MDVKADSASTGLTPPGPPPPPVPAQAPGTAARVDSADAAGGPAGVGGDGVSKSGAGAGAGALVLDLGKVLPAPLEEQKKEGALDAAAARVQGGCPSVVVDIKSEHVKGADAGGDDEGSWNAEKECRICHVNPDRRESLDVSELIQLGCGCKSDLGIAHRNCAEAWFKLKGNRCCEICGLPAKNVTGIEDANFLEEWNEGGTLSNNGNGTANERCRCWRGQPLCNFLMACLVIAFVLPWFFRVNIF